MAAETSARRPYREPNRLHRSTERLELVLSCLLGLLMAGVVGVAFVAGGSASGSVAERARVEAAERTPVRAVLLADAKPVTRGSDPAARRVPARWSDRHGLDRTELVRVKDLHRAGDRVTVWTAPDGRVVPEPASLADAAVVGFLVGTMTFGVAGGVVYLTGRGMYAWTGRRFARAWELEWERVGPEWTGGTPR